MLVELLHEVLHSIQDMVRYSTFLQPGALRSCQLHKDRLIVSVITGSSCLVPQEQGKEALIGDHSSGRLGPSSLRGPRRGAGPGTFTPARSRLLLHPGRAEHPETNHVADGPLPTALIAHVYTMMKGTS